MLSSSQDRYELQPNFDEMLKKHLCRGLSNEEAYRLLISPKTTLSNPIKLYQHHNKECKRREILFSMNFSLPEGVDILSGLLKAKYQDKVVDKDDNIWFRKFTLSDVLDNKYVLFWFEELGNFAYPLNEQYHTDLYNKLQVIVDILNQELQSNNFG